MLRLFKIVFQTSSGSGVVSHGYFSNIVSMFSSYFLKCDLWPPHEWQLLESIQDDD